MAGRLVVLGKALLWSGKTAARGRAIRLQTISTVLKPAAGAGGSPTASGS